MNDLEKILGEVITVKQVADYLNINEKTVREHFQELGGIRIGRQYKFFERGIIDAIQKSQKQIYSASQEEQSAPGKGIQLIEIGQKLGGPAKKNVRRRMERDDRHGLLD